MACALFPAHAPRQPVTFLSLDELAAHLIRQRPGREVHLESVQVSRDGAPMQPAVVAYALRPRDLRAFHDDPAAFRDDWLGIVLAGDRPWAALTAALQRVRTAGGLAA